MDWIKKLKKGSPRLPPEKIAPEPDNNTVCLEAFKCHWFQINEIISVTSPRHAYHQNGDHKIDNTTYDDVDAVRNLLEQMIYLLIEEQATDQLLGPVLDYTITQNIFQKLAEWCESASSFKEQIMLTLLKIYEVLISQAQHSLLHHKQLVSPMLKILSFSYEPVSEELDGHIVLLLNLLCVWMNRDPTLLEVFFSASSPDHGSTNFLIFSLLIEYIHREGTVGQQARDALLLCMSLSAENEDVAKYIVETSNFCPVLAIGLSGLYSTLPRHMEVRADDWHCLQKSDWSHVPELTNFMNSFEFCNSVVEVAHPLVSNLLLELFYNGFLVSVFGPSLHKTSADEVVVTTAYLNLFLRSVTAPALMRCFLQFLLTHRHDNSLIVNTLIQRIASGNRLALVSLSLIRTLVDLNCEDLMLQLVFRYLIPCQHILASQRRAIRDVDIYNASASRFLALTPTVCAPDVQEKEEDILVPVTNQPKPTEANDSETPMPNTPATPQSSTDAITDSGNSAFHSLSPPAPLHGHQTSSFHHKPLNHPSMKSPTSVVDQALSNYSVNEDLSVTISMHSATPSGPSMELTPTRPRTISNPNTMAEFGPDLSSQLELNTSYMDYLEDAKYSIDQCREACSGWSSAYDGREPIDIATIEPSDCAQSDVAKPPDNSSSGELMSTVQPPDLIQAGTDPALKALSATFQTLSLTALARNQRQDTSSKVATSNAVPVASESGTAPVQRQELEENVSTKTEGTENGAEKIKPEKNEAIDDEQNEIEKADVTSIASGSKTATSEKSCSNDSQVKSDGDADSRTRSGTTVSSVDEFFRSLMEIVPTTTKDRLNSHKGTKTNGTALLEDDIESGIEISSEGDNQAINREQLKVETSDKDSEQNEDTMSQLSLNTDEITGDADKPSTDRSDLLLEEERTRTYSFADDTDTEFDDTMSIASSFYEPHDEYVPTEISVAPSVPLKIQGLPYTGPLISNLFAKLDQMISNSLFENLMLTGIVARMAAYPQPLLRSFLLNTNMVFHPAVKSLYQVLNSARNKIDLYAEDVSDFKILVRRAQKYLLARGTYPFSGDARTRNNVQDRPMPVPKVKTRTLGGMFKRKRAKDANKKKSSIIPGLETLMERRKGTIGDEDDDKVEERKSGSMFYIKHQKQEREKEEKKLRELRTKNAVYASIVLAEFLKELAAIAQEHAVASLTN